MTPAERFANLCQQFENLATRAAKLGNFLNIEQLFLDAQIYSDAANRELVRAAGDLHLSEDFIQPGTTPTEVFFEVYRRVMFSETAHSDLDWADLANALMHLERLIMAEEVETGARGAVVNLFGDRTSDRA